MTLASEPPAPAPAPAAAPSPAEHGLARATMGPFEVLAQSVAGIAPSAVMATGPALVALGAGDAVLYSYLVSTVVLLMVGWCISRFTARHGTGTLLSYINAAFGPGAGFLGSAGLAFGYALIAVGSVAGFALYLQPLLQLVGLPGTTSLVATVLLEVVAVALAAFAMVRGVELSTRVGVVLEIVSVISILVVVVAVLSTTGLSAAPLHPHGLGVSSITGGMVLAILGYVGFESAACMGTEAKNPTRSVPRAVLGSALIAGVLYLISAYAQLVGFGGSADLVKNAASPMNTLADSAGVHPLGYLIDLGATASFFACITGSLNAAARLLLSMSRARLLPAPVGRTHPVHRTPHVAIGTLSAVTLVVALSMTLSGGDVVSTFAIAGTIGTYGYMLAYVLLCLGTPVYLRRIGAPFGAALAVGGLAAVAMLYVAFRAVYPVQAYPYDVLPVVFVAVMALAMAWYAVARTRNGGPVLIEDGPSEEVLDLRDAPADEAVVLEGATEPAARA